MTPSEIPQHQKASQRNFIYHLLVSILLVIPCFWQSRIQAGDLSSHIYNAWLTIQVQRGAVAGLFITHQYTNIAFDLLLSWLLPLVGVNLAQRLAVSCCVLVLCWGVLKFVDAVSGKHSWGTEICVAMLAYGFVFHLGLFNFYLSTGLCFLFLGLTWGRTDSKNILFTIPLLLLAWSAHPLPVLWTIAAFLYQKLARVIPEFAWILFIVSFAAVIVLRMVIMRLYPTVWSPAQISMSTGADQVFLYGRQYVIVMVLLLLAWAAMMHNLARQVTWHGVLSNTSVQLWILTALSLAMLPRSILFNSHKAPITFLPERLSLFCGILVCALLAKVKMSSYAKTLLLLAVTFFFIFCYQDDQRLNHLEDRVSASLQTVPSMGRVVFIPKSETTRLPPPLHIIDRVCIGRCLSYGNYEPASGHFRLRAKPHDPGVINSYWELQDLEQQHYIVRPKDLPLYQSIRMDDVQPNYKTIQLTAGARVTEYIGAR
jgi:hypothetical protein